MKEPAPAPHNPYLHHPDTLPCFRCGGQIEILVPPPENIPYFGWWCTKCGIKAPSYDFPTLEATILDANRRVPAPLASPEAQLVTREGFTPHFAFVNMLTFWDAKQIREFYEMLSRRPECVPQGGDKAQGLPSEWWCANCNGFRPAQYQHKDLVCGCGHVIASVQFTGAQGKGEEGEGPSGTKDLEPLPKTVGEPKTALSERDSNGHLPRKYRAMDCCADCGLILPASAQCRGKVTVRTRAAEDAEVLDLCLKHGFGAVMGSASRQWRERDPVGAISMGECYGVLKASSSTHGGAASAEPSKESSPPPLPMGELREALDRLEGFLWAWKPSHPDESFVAAGKDLAIIRRVVEGSEAPAPVARPMKPGDLPDYDKGRDPMGFFND